MQTGGGPNTSDALTINGQPGDLLPCSMPGRHLICIGRTKVIICVCSDELKITFNNNGLL